MACVPPPAAKRFPTWPVDRQPRGSGNHRRKVRARLGTLHRPEDWAALDCADRIRASVSDSKQSRIVRFEQLHKWLVLWSLDCGLSETLAAPSSIFQVTSDSDCVRFPSEISGVFSCKTLPHFCLDPSWSTRLPYIAAQKAEVRLGVVVSRSADLSKVALQRGVAFLLGMTDDTHSGSRQLGLSISNRATTPPPRFQKRATTRGRGPKLGPPIWLPSPQSSCKGTTIRTVLRWQSSRKTMIS